MAVRTTVDIPEPLHQTLKERAQQSGTSIRALIVRAIELSYAPEKKGRCVTSPPMKSKGKRGPRYPVDENPHDLVFS